MTSVTYGPMPRAARRSWWMEEALAQAELSGPPCPPLSGDLTADVVILGGGYTGMWSAYFLTERAPGIDVVLLEQDVCGGGPSGRNGGFVNGLWDELPELTRRYGHVAARRTCELAARSIDEIGEFCERHGIDAWYVRAGDIAVATSPDQEAALERAIRDAAQYGVPDRFVRLGLDELRARFDSPVVRAAAFAPDSAGVQPARLALGLRRVLLERGVRIFEQTPATRFRAGRSPVVHTPRGSVRARRAILGLNAWAVALRAFHRSLMVRGTSIVLTTPAPGRLAEIGWTGGEGVYDLRTSLHYLRATPDGRIAFGGAGMLASTRGRIDERFDYDEEGVRRLVQDLYTWFPSFRDVPLEAAWSGPIDVSARHLPFFGTLPGGAVHYGLGFTGNGVGPCHLGGKILSGLALDASDEHTTLPIVDDRPGRFPPDPIFVPAERIVSRAIVRRDDRLGEGARPGRLTELLARIPRRAGYNLGP